MKFYVGQKFGNKFGIRINIIDVDGLYIHTECYNIENINDRTNGIHVDEFLEEHLIENDFEEIK